MSLTHLHTVDEVFRALGEIKGVMKLTGAKYRRAHNWKQKPGFPKGMHKLFTLALEEKGFTAPAELWGQIVETEVAE